MEPVKRSHHNTIYESPEPNIKDLSGYAVEGGFASHWRPNSEELAVLVEGGDIEVMFFSTPFPPFGVGVVEAVADGLPADPESQEVVEVGGLEWRVPEPVATELWQYRRGLVESLKEWASTVEVKPTDTVLITVPDDAGPQMSQAIALAAKQQFPENRACILPVSLGLHTQDKFVELIECGAEMAEKMASDPVGALAAATKWKELVSG